MSDAAQDREHMRVERILMTAVEQYNETGELAESCIGRTLNVSEGGILLEVHEPLPFMAKVTLSLAIKEDIIKADGEVVHLRKTKDNKVEMGIRFMNLSENDLRTIKKHITR